MAASTFNFNANTLLTLLRRRQQQQHQHQHRHQPYISPFYHSFIPFSLSLKPKTIFHHYALTPHSSSLPNSSASKHDHPPSPSTKTLNFKQATQTATGYSSFNSSKLQTATKNTRKFSSDRVNKKKNNNENVVEKKSRNNKKGHDTPEMKLRVALDMCSKKGDVLGALSLYDSAKSEGVKLGQHHYTVLLYLCSSAAVGVVRPAKSGTGARTLNSLVSSSNETLNIDKSSGSIHGNNNSDVTFDNADLTASVLDFNEKSEKKETDPLNQEDHGILVSEDVKKYALQRGFEVYENMCMDKVQMNEAALTSVARMAMSMGDGDMAFEMVKQMKSLGISPRLRSYGPALSTFCNNGEVDKAFDVEKHMLELGVYPEEPELEALLRVSIGAGKGDKVYYVLHKLRSSVRKVSPVTAYLIIEWFKSTQASRVGKRKWDKRLIKEAIENNGGGWHGQGWLGKGKWQVSETTIGNDGMCKCCGVHLATIDLDPVETENFAKSVASIAIMREKKSNFQKFQKWLDYYGPFEAVVDAANVGLFGQRRFMPSKINAVVNGIRQKLPSKKFPLIILHNKRIKGDKMDEPINRAFIDRWNNADALYATPTGSNDDWYWLYAAIKFKCLIVTNDEMRDHLFQLLGNDFFPKWKERHQVHFSFTDTGPEFHMPPPCSVVIQESEEGHWHIPIESEHNYESERRWLCISRGKLDMVGQDFSTSEDSKSLQNGECARSAPTTASTKELQHQNLGNQEEIKETPQEMYKNLRDIFSASYSILNISNNRMEVNVMSSSNEKPEAEADLEESMSFDKSLKELRELRSQLHHAAEYCETTFLKSKERSNVLESTKEYICRTVVTVVDHLGNVSANLEGLISQTNAFSEAELRIQCLKQRLLSCEQYANEFTLAKTQFCDNLPRLHSRYLSTPTLERSSSEKLSDSESQIPPKMKEKHVPATHEDLPLFKCNHKPHPVQNLKPTTSKVKGHMVPVGDGLSVLTKVPNPTFHFQSTLKVGQVGRHRRSLHGSDILWLIRRTKRTQ